MRATAFLVAFFTGIIAYSQNVNLVPYKKIGIGEKSVNTLSFSSDAAWIAASDARGETTIHNIENNEVIAKLTSADVVLHEFIDNNKKFILLDKEGEFTVYTFDTRQTQTINLANGIKKAIIDPNQHYLTFLERDNRITIHDLKANMTFGRIAGTETLNNTLYIGYDRFGQQLAAIDKTGEAVTWNPFNQKLLRQLKLQSGEYAGSRSAIHAVSTNSGGDRFVVGLQEIFIPKGGMQGRSQPERRNMIISYDWATGQEYKRIPLRLRIDGMAMGPGLSHVAFFSTDSRTISMLNMESAVVNSSVSVDERPSCIALSDDNAHLAVGTAGGYVYLYEVVYNNAAEIKIHRPSLNRNYGEQTVKEALLKIEGEVESNEKINKVFVNGEPTPIDLNNTFSADVSLVKGKNRINIAAQNSEGIVTEKDIYITCDLQAQQQTNKTPAHRFNKRFALVIGNGSYAQAARLNNTINDANAMAAVLKELGFEVLTVTDGSYEQMKNAIYTFGDRIHGTDVSLFYYAGHGLEVDGTNYLVPVDADVQSALDVKLKAIPLTGVLRTMEFANDEGLNMLILDACRNNPFPTGKRSGGAGLVQVQPPSGTLIAYATDPGSVASDGDQKHGLYTGELVKQLRISQRIEDIFMNTRNAVEKLSSGKQRPWEEARLKGVFYLK